MVCLDLFKKIKKKRDEKSSPMPDEYLEAEKERLRKSHEANELFLSLSLSLVFGVTSLLLTHLFFCLFVTTHQILTLFRT